MRRCLKKWSKEMGFHRIGKNTFGELGGYLFTIHQGMYECTLSVSGSFPDVNQKSRMGQMLHNPGVMKENGLIGVVFQDHAIAFQFNGNKKSIVKMKRFLDWLIPALKKERFSDSGICSFCCSPIQNGDGEYVLLEDHVIRLHEQCMNRMFLPGTMYNPKQYQDGYIKGASFALLFALLGSLPMIYLFIFGWNVGILSMLIVFMAYKGYEISKAKRTKTAVWVIGLISFLASQAAVGLGMCFNSIAGISEKLNPYLNIYFSVVMILFSLLICGRDILDLSGRRKVVHIDKKRYEKKENRKEF